MATVHGLPACTCLAAWIPAFEGAIGRTLRWFQLIGDAPASAGFHKGGGSGDTEILSDEELRIARNMGGAAWNRFWANNYHCHIRLNGCSHNSVAQPQVADLNEGRDGTGPLYDNAGVPDNGPRDGVHWPLRTWREGIEWAEAQMEDDMAWDEEITRWYPGDENKTDTLKAGTQLNQARGYAQEAYRCAKRADIRTERIEKALTVLAASLGEKVEAAVREALADAVVDVDVNVTGGSDA